MTTATATYRIIETAYVDGEFWNAIERETFEDFDDAAAYILEFADVVGDEIDLDIEYTIEEFTDSQLQDIRETLTIVR